MLSRAWRLNYEHVCAFGRGEEAVSGGKPLLGKGVDSMLSWHGSHFWVCITFCNVQHGDGVTRPDYYYYNYYCSIIYLQIHVMEKSFHTKFVCNALYSLHYITLHHRFSTCGPRTTGGPRQSAWWSAIKAWYFSLFTLNLAIEMKNRRNLFVFAYVSHCITNMLFLILFLFHLAEAAIH